MVRALQCSLSALSLTITPPAHRVLYGFTAAESTIRICDFGRLRAAPPRRAGVARGGARTCPATRRRASTGGKNLVKTGYFFYKAVFLANPHFSEGEETRSTQLEPPGATVPACTGSGTRHRLNSLSVTYARIRLGGGRLRWRGGVALSSGGGLVGGGRGGRAGRQLLLR